MEVIVSVEKRKYGSVKVNVEFAPGAGDRAKKRQAQLAALEAIKKDENCINWNDDDSDIVADFGYYVP